MDAEEAVSCSLANIMNIINAIKPNNGDKTTQKPVQKTECPIISERPIKTNEKLSTQISDFQRLENIDTFCFE